eukprot:CAMPEP_0168857348 /NCGR_PEP_ID=MMETSP0727-20121128/15683_1 /TAXON_ID=265536 /ORGANISM="Amphiprora sp., Strain CCMP467" /LENGTH=330 /DNA_ID=CAMNT_0008911973 /DNA_START=39 /DNA_END=1029 /DNA_ORIENTATION=+
MTSTPWMKGIDVPVADAMPLVSQHDDRPSAKELIAEHQEKIDKIKAGLMEAKDDEAAALFDYPNKHDDLWLLRFYLSHKKTKPAIAAAKSALKFRQKYKLDELGDIRDIPPQAVKEGHVREYWKERCQDDAIVCCLPDKQLGPVMFLAFARFDPKAADLLSEECWDFAFIYTSEWVYQWCDYITRTTGLFTRSVRFIDMKGITLSKLMDRKSSKRDGKKSRGAGDVVTPLVNPFTSVNKGKVPTLFTEQVRSLGVKPGKGQKHDGAKLLVGDAPNLGLLPSYYAKRIMEKVDMITPQNNESEKMRLLRFVALENLPTEMGGTNSVPPMEW